MKGIIFDCDGVLFESRRANLEYYNSVLARFGIAPITEADKSQADLCHTAASPEVFRALLGEDLVAEALEIASMMNYRDFIPFMTPAEDLEEALAVLSRQQVLAVATNRGNSMAEILVHFGLQNYFRVVVTSKDVARPKPAPDMLQLACRRLGVRPEDLLFVGDSILDQQAAAEAGMPFVAFGNTLPGAPTIRHHRELLSWGQGVSTGF